MKDKDMFEVIDAIEEIIGNCNLTDIELLGIFEVIKDNIHKSNICNDCARELYGKQNEKNND